MRIIQRGGREMLTLWGYGSLDAAPPTARFFYVNIESGNALFWALEDAGAIVGELYVFRELEDRDFADGVTTAYLCAFRVREEYRGRGFGSRLMETSLADLRARGFRRATIGVGMDEEANKAMYRHMGFETEIKACYADPCAMDEQMRPRPDEGFLLLSKSL